MTKLVYICLLHVNFTNFLDVKYIFIFFCNFEIKVGFKEIPLALYHSVPIYL